MAIQPPQRFELDDLAHVEREARTIYAPGATPGDVLIVQSDHSLVAAPGGGAQPGASIVRAFPFTFDTPGLANGAALYTPTVGEVLLDAWIEVDTAWDGTTPLCDFGTFAGLTSGLVAATGSGDVLDLSNVDSENNGAGMLMNTALWGLAGLIAQGGGSRVAPLKFTTADPFKVVVSQDGSAGGADPGAMQGAAVLYLVTATPT